MESQKIEIRVDANKLNAFVILHSEEISKEEILSALKSVGIKFGLMEGNLEKLVRHPITEEPVLIAKGKPPVDGNDAIVEHRLSGEKREKKPVMLKNGSVNYKEVRSYDVVSAGDILAVKKGATKGENGVDVFGNEIPAKDGKDVKIPNGKNTKLIRDGTVLIATRDGIPKIGENVIEVEEVLEIDGDVDYSTGNVDFPGDVHIKGGVKPTFVVKAKGNVKIDGIIEAATVQSEMNVECHGVKGKNKGIIYAKGDIRAMFLENANVECKGSLYVRDSIVNSVVRAGKSVEVLEGKGEIVGSNIAAKISVSAKRIGSWISSSTRIEVGIDPELRDRISELSAKIYIDKENLEKVMKLVEALEDMKKKLGGTLPADKEETYTKLKKTRYALYSSLSKMIEEMKECQKKSNIETSQGKVVVTSKAFPDLELKIGNARMMLNKEVGPTRFVNQEGKVVPLKLT